MPWLLVLHISALLCWCGSLLYLPALIRGSITEQNSLAPLDLMRNGKPCLPRMVFTLVATPAALFAIASGTAIFLFYGIVEFWLLAKLTLVVGLVIVHMLVGLLVARLEQAKHGHLPTWCLLAGVVAAGLIAVIVWLVLYKPLQEV